LTPETDHADRYDYVIDPCNLYVVWDRVADVPAMGAGGLLAFVTAKEAIAAIHRLNQQQSSGSKDRPVAVKDSLRH